MSKHTDGPWTGVFEDDNFSVWADGNGDSVLENAHMTGKNSRADAKLILLAPAMLEALQWYAGVEGDTRAAAIVARATGITP